MGEDLLVDWDIHVLHTYRHIMQENTGWMPRSYKTEVLTNMTRDMHNVSIAMGIIGFSKQGEQFSHNRLWNAAMHFFGEGSLVGIYSMVRKVSII